MIKFKNLQKVISNLFEGGDFKINSALIDLDFINRDFLPINMFREILKEKR